MVGVDMKEIGKERTLQPREETESRNIDAAYWEWFKEEEIDEKEKIEKETEKITVTKGQKKNKRSEWMKAEMMQSRGNYRLRMIYRG